MRLLVMLQNPWCPRADLRARWSKRLWLRLLRRSRSGKRLQVVLGDDWSGIEFANTNPCVAPDTKPLPVDVDHVRQVLAAVKPSIVLACGLQAERVCRKLWPGRLVCIPHPAYRVVTNSLLERARELLADEWFHQGALRQGRGKSHVQMFPRNA